MSQYLGDISAYALAVSQGYTGTEEEYAELMASYATVGQTAVTAAQTATTKASEAATSATTATNKASEATTAATTATTKAGEASTSASTATSAKDTAVSASQTATPKATEATTAAATATSAATTATTAKDDAVSAKTAAQTAQTGAETAAASVQSSAEQIATNAEDISQLKSDFTDMNADINPNNNGEFVWPLRYGYWFIGTGTPVWTSTNKFLASAYPIKVKSGDVIHLKDTKNIRYFAARSTDGVTWSALASTTAQDCAITTDGYVLVSARKEPNSLSFTTDDEKIFFDDYLTIVRKTPTDNISKEVGNINTASGILINKASYKQSYVSNTSAADVAIPLSLVFPATAGDTFEISVESLAATVHPEYYSNVKLAVYEVYNGSTVWISSYDITDPVTYTIKNANADSISLNAKLVKESTSSVLSGYYENIEFNIFAVKKTEDLTDAMTESGSIWEV